MSEDQAREDGTSDGVAPPLIPQERGMNLDEEGPVPPYRPGDVIAGHLEVKQCLRGGMAWVFVVFDRRDRVPRALKTFRWEGLADTRRRARWARAFQEEIRIWTALDSCPTLVQARWAQVLEGRLFLALEYVPPPPWDPNGIPRSLRHYLLGEPLPEDRLWRWALELCHALTFFHHQTTPNRALPCHGDLKPSNVMITPELGVKVTDFGVAACLSLASREVGKEATLGSARRLPGTPGYLSPEQYQGLADLEARSDIYNFGLVLHQMVTGSPIPPFVESLPADPDETYRRQRADSPSPLAHPLWPLLARCLAFDRDQRYGSFDELGEELARAYEAEVGKRFEPPAPEPTELWERENRASTLVTLRLYEEAAAEAAGVLQSAPDSVAALNVMAAVHVARGEYEAAQRYQTHALRLAPEDPRLLCNQAAICLQQRDPATAREHYTRALALDEASAEAYAGRARASLALGDPQRALSDLDRAIALRPREARARFARGLLHQDLGLLAEALADLQTAAELDPTSAEYQSGLGGALVAVGRDEEAEARFSAAIGLEPEVAEHWSNRGNTRARLGGLDEALSDYHQALRLQPDLADAWLNRALTEERLGRGEEAVVSYREFLRHASPDDPAAADVRRRLAEFAPGEPRLC